MYCKYQAVRVIWIPIHCLALFCYVSKSMISICTWEGLIERLGNQKEKGMIQAKGNGINSEAALCRSLLTDFRPVAYLCLSVQLMRLVLLETSFFVLTTIRMWDELYIRSFQLKSTVLATVEMCVGKNTAQGKTALSQTAG